MFMLIETAWRLSWPACCLWLLAGIVLGSIGATVALMMCRAAAVADSCETEETNA